jgi:hypothetical protein
LDKLLLLKIILFLLEMKYDNLLLHLHLLNPILHYHPLLLLSNQLDHSIHLLRLIQMLLLKLLHVLNLKAFFLLLI